MKIAVLTISGIATLVCWYFIVRSKEPWYVKLVSAIVAVVPIFGPFFYATLFHNTPSVQPEEQQANMSHRLSNTKARNYDPVFPEEKHGSEDLKKQKRKKKKSRM